MKKLILLFLLVSVSSSHFSNAQAKDSEKKKFQATYNNSKVIAQSQNFNFIGETVFNGEKRERLNSNINTIKINKDEISGSITAFESTNYMLTLTGAIENYKISFDDEKQLVAITFKVKTEAQFLEVKIDIKPNGNAILTTPSGNYNNISWIGRIK